MNTLRSHEAASQLLCLPAETRLLIYSFLIPRQGLYIDLCDASRPQGADFITRKRSVISNILQQTFTFIELERTNGLHLLLVCKRTRFEILPMLAKTTVRFHCSKCFDDLLRHFSYGLGVGVKQVSLFATPSTRLSSYCPSMKMDA